MILNILFGFGFVGAVIVAGFTLRDNRKLTRQNKTLHDGLRHAAQRIDGMKLQVEAAMRERDRAIAERNGVVRLHGVVAAGDERFDVESAKLGKPEAALHIGGFAVTQIDSHFQTTQLDNSGFQETKVEVHRRT